MTQMSWLGLEGRISSASFFNLGCDDELLLYHVLPHANFLKALKTLESGAAMLHSICFDHLHTACALKLPLPVTSWMILASCSLARISSAP